MNFKSNSNPLYSSRATLPLDRVGDAAPPPLAEFTRRAEEFRQDERKQKQTSARKVQEKRLAQLLRLSGAVLVFAYCRSKNKILLSDDTRSSDALTARRLSSRPTKLATKLSDVLRFTTTPTLNASAGGNCANATHPGASRRKHWGQARPPHSHPRPPSASIHDCAP